MILTPSFYRSGSQIHKGNIVQNHSVYEFQHLDSKPNFHGQKHVCRWIALCSMGCPAHHRIPNSTFGLYSLEINSLLFLKWQSNMSPDITKGLRHWDEETKWSHWRTNAPNLVFMDPGRAHGEDSRGPWTGWEIWILFSPNFIRNLIFLSIIYVSNRP